MSNIAQPAHWPQMAEGNEAALLLDSLDALRAVITIFDRAGRLLYANAHLNYLLRSLPPCRTLIGKSYEEIVRLEIAGGEIAPEMLADGVSAFIARRLAQLDEKAYAPCDIALADRRVLEIKARRGAGGNTVLLWSDVTAARAQLARLEDAVSLSAEAFAFFDARDRLIMANSLYVQLCGAASLDELAGRTFPEIVTRVVCGGRVLVDEPVEQWLERRLMGHRMPAGAATLRLNSGACYLVRDRATADGGRVVVFTDITDKVRAETALAEQQDALAGQIVEARKQSLYLADLADRLDAASAKVDRAKTTLLRTMGHELKTPLNAILGFSDLMSALADSLTPEQTREYAGLVHAGGNNLLKIINQILDLTKISAGRYELRRVPVDVGGVLWLARDVHAARAEARGIALDMRGCPAGLTVMADETVLTAMVQALLDNAVSFSQAGTIALAAAPAEEGVALTVEDDGIGVLPEDLERILEPFEHAGRGDHASGNGPSHVQGAGLGLTLVKAFAELHGGRLELASRHGEGFRAAIILPASPAPKF